MLSAFGVSTIVAIIIGGGLAILAFLPMVAYRYRKVGRLRFLDMVLLLGVVIYAMTLWTYTLVPLPETADYTCASANFYPFEFVKEVIKEGLPITHNRSLFHAFFNVIFFIPLGAILRFLAHKGIVFTTLIGFGVSALIETTQLTGIWGIYKCAYRYFDADDLILNTSGALLGSLIGIPVAWLFGKSRPLPKVTTVTFGRRFVGMVADVIAIGFIGFPTAIAWRAVQLYLLGVPAREMVPTMDQIFLFGVPGLVQLCFVLIGGRTLGETIVQLRPVPSSRMVVISRIIKYITGVGGFVILASDLVPNIWIILGFLLVTLVFAALGDHRGLSHKLARMELEIETNEPESKLD
ncbi:MAG: VanZ family protein [Propionibacteriaceae bacterium]|nr:VanZ family protein [Propionibacteriaceae bacterium]